MGRFEIKKDKEWLKEEALKLYPDNTDIYEHPDYIVVEKTKIVSDFLELIDQLEEPEQEKVVVPQFVGDFITEIKPNFNIRAAFTLQNNNHEQGQEWALDNPDVFAKAWIDGYTLEKYRRVLKIGKMYFVSGGANHEQEFNIKLTDNKESAYVFESEQEAKDLQSDTGGKLEEITK